jgi:mannosyltransferase
MSSKKPSAKSGFAGITKKTTWIFLAVALLAGISLQLATLTKWSFWFDESYTSALVSFSPAEIIDLTAIDVHPPLYYLLLDFWATLFGSSDLALRSFSVIATIVGLILLFFLIKRMFNETAAGLVVMFTSMAPYVVRYAQEARMYSLVSALLVGATLVLVKIAQQRPQGRRRLLWWLAYAALMAAALYTHYFSGLLLVAHALYFFFYSTSGGEGSLARRAWHRIKTIDRFWLGANIAVVLLYLPWIPTLLNQFDAVNAGFWIPDVSSIAFINTFSMFTIFYELPGWTWQAWLLLAVAVALALVTFKTIHKISKEQRLNLGLLLGALIVPAVLLFIISAPEFTSSYYNNRYLAQFSLLFYGGLAVLLYLGYKYGPRYTVITLAIVLAVLCSFGTARVINGVDKQNTQMNNLFSIVSDNYQPGDAILAVDFGDYFNARHYNQTDSEVLLIEPGYNWGSLEPARRRGEIIPDYTALDSPSGRVWYITNKNDNNAPANWLPLGPRYEMGDSAIQLFATDRYNSLAIAD